MYFYRVLFSDLWSFLSLNGVKVMKKGILFTAKKSDVKWIFSFYYKLRMIATSILLFLIVFNCVNLQSQNVTYSQSFVKYTTYLAGSPQYDGWITFRNSLNPGTYTKLIIKGSLDTTGVSITNATIVNEIAAALKNPDQNEHYWVSNGRNWSVGWCGDGPELSANEYTCTCYNPGYTVRPQIGNYNWGGIKTVTCASANQTLTVVFEAPAVAPPALTAAATPSTICSGMDVLLSAISSGNMINWYTASSGGNSIGSSLSNSPFRVAPFSSTSYYAEIETLDNILQAFNTNFTNITSLIPNRYNFVMDGPDGVLSTLILTGGNSMFSNGNILNTNLATSIQYKDNTITASNAFGPKGKYFSRKVSGLFVMAAQIDNLSEFFILGNSGNGANSTTSLSDFTITVYGISYRCFLKKISTPTTPTINQLIIIPNESSLAQSTSFTTNNCGQKITGLSKSNQLYYLLFSTTAGTIINNTQATNIANSFISTIKANPGTNSRVEVSVQVQSPEIPIVNSSERCGEGSVTLDANVSTGSVDWFETPTLGNSLGSNNQFTTPTLSESKTYYVQSQKAPNKSFKITSLNNTNSFVTDHFNWAGEDRGGIAITQNYIYYVGDNNTVRYNMPNLTNPVSLAKRDGLLCDFSGTGKVFTLWNSTNSTEPSGTNCSFIVNSIRELNPDLSYSSNIIPLSKSFTMGSGTDARIFSGFGFVILYTGGGIPANTFYKVDLQSGETSVIAEGSFSSYGSESWASHGIAEFSDSKYSVVYRSSTDNSINRYTFGLGETVVQNFQNLSDMESIIYSPWNNRWYFHFENQSQFGGTNESIGYADGTHYISGSCVSSRQAVQAIIHQVPDSVSIESNVSLCGGAVLNASGGEGGTIFWQDVYEDGTNTDAPLESIEINTPGTYFFRAYNAEGSCWGEQASVDVFFDNLTPTNLTTCNISLNSASLNWSDDSTVTHWDVSYVESGNDVSSGTIIEMVSNSPYQIENLLPNTAYDVYVRRNCGSSVGDWSEVHTFETTNLISWTGAVNNQWENPLNWLPNMVPTIDNNVRICPVSRLPIISNNLSNPAECNNITIGVNASVCVSANSGFTIFGNLENNGTLKVLSNATGDGSVIVYGQRIGNGKDSIQRFLSENTWHYISSPISHALSGVFQGIWLRPYSESSKEFGNYIVPVNIPLPVGQGFTTWTNTQQTRIFGGNINNEPISPIALTLSGSVEQGYGFNLVGNPYPSAINWDLEEGWDKTGIANTIYIWNKNQYAVYNGIVGINGGSPNISMGQGFFVQAITQNAHLGINNAACVHEQASFLKVNNQFDLVKIKVFNDNFADETAIIISDDANSQYDYRYDATKMWGNNSSAQLFTKKNYQLLSINSMESVNSLFGEYVFVEIPDTTTYYLNYSFTSNEANLPVLYDHLAQVMIYPNEPYAFSIFPNQPKERFEFIQALTNQISDSKLINIAAWESNNLFYVEVKGDDNIKEIQFFDALGQLVLKSNTSVTSLNEMAQGVYIARISIGNETFTKKFILND